MIDMIWKLYYNQIRLISTFLKMQIKLEVAYAWPWAHEYLSMKSYAEYILNLLLMLLSRYFKFILRSLKSDSNMFIHIFFCCLPYLKNYCLAWRLAEIIKQVIAA